MGLKVAVVGLWSETKSLVPWSDAEWEKWGLAWDADVFRMDRAFEMHCNREIAEYAKPDYMERLGMLPALYLQEANSDLPGAKAYPFAEVAETTGEYWASSIGYMLALAIHEGAEEIAVYGVAMESHEEYGYQRPNCEYLIGLARGKGIKVHIPGPSPLCKFGGQFGYAGRYGRLEA